MIAEKDVYACTCEPTNEETLGGVSHRFSVGFERIIEQVKVRDTYLYVCAFPHIIELYRRDEVNVATDKETFVNSTHQFQWDLDTFD